MAKPNFDHLEDQLTALSERSPSTVISKDELEKIVRGAKDCTTTQAKAAVEDLAVKLPELIA